MSDLEVNKQPQCSGRRRGRALGTVVSMTVLLMLSSSHVVNPLNFQDIVGRPNRRARTTKLFFQSLTDLRPSEESIIDSRRMLNNNAFLKKTMKVPTFLTQPSSESIERQWSRLRNSMKESLFTTTEYLRLNNAIVRAAQGDRYKMGGAAELCLILVETTEMGLDALIAAAYHYCACVVARGQSLSPSGTYREDEDYVHDLTDLQCSFGDDTANIAKDAACLKRLELMAEMVRSSSKRSGARVTPDQTDAANFRSLLLTETKDWRALAIRAAAALYRLRRILKEDNGDGDSKLTPEINRISREALHVYAPLASRLGFQRLKNELEGAAFRILYRRQYERVTTLAQDICQGYGCTEDQKNEVSESRKSLLECVKEEMTEMLRKDTHFSKYVEKFSVTGRMKEPYSMWKKMLNKETLNVLDIPDAMALRIVLDAKKKIPNEDDQVTKARERALCYYTQNICIQRWKPSESDPRFKDYVEKPKRNGYQSLHYTACCEFGGEDSMMEIQVRSGAMHQVAEFGLAAHWDYKSTQQTIGAKQEQDYVQNHKSIPVTRDHSTDGYLRSAQEWHWEQQGLSRQTNYLFEARDGISTDVCESQKRADQIRERTERMKASMEALTTAQSNLAREHVFVFLCGKVFSLPSGSCVLDALREAEKIFQFALPRKGKRFSLVSHNGGVAIATSPLQNGDVLTLPFQ